MMVRKALFLVSKYCTFLSIIDALLISASDFIAVENDLWFRAERRCEIASLDNVLIISLLRRRIYEVNDRNYSTVFPKFRDVSVKIKKSLLTANHFN